MRVDLDQRCDRCELDIWNQKINKARVQRRYALSRVSTASVGQALSEADTLAALEGLIT